MKTGYKNVCESHPAAAALATDGKAFMESLLEQIEKLPERRVTRTELVRDFGFTPSGLKVAEAERWLSPRPDGGTRKVYDLKEAMRFLILFAGFAKAPQTRVIRKFARIQTVARQVVERSIAPEPFIADGTCLGNHCPAVSQRDANN